MSSENEFIIEFPADRNYIPFVQDFLRDFLENFDFSKEFSEKTAGESLTWFNSIIPQEKLLQALSPVSFSGKISSKQELHVQIKTTDDKLFTTSLTQQNSGDAK
jgi:hypothetical protein